MPVDTAPHPAAWAVRARMTASGRQANNLAGVAMFIFCVACYTSLFLASLSVAWWPLQLLAALLNGAVIFLVLCVGHDAAHGNLMSSRLLNHLIGRLAFLPSLTPFSIWAYTHNRLHHGFTNLRGYDMAFAPFTKEEFARLPAWRRALERSYKTVPGLALYYLIEIWWKYVFAFRSRRSDFGTWILYALDRLLVIGFVALQAVSVLLWQVYMTPAGTEPAQSAWTGMLVGLVVPWLSFCWVIGIVSFLQHTHPKVRWYERRAEWSFYGGQVQGSVHVVFPWPRAWRLLHAIIEHSAHHADCRIPTVDLMECQQELENAYPEIVVEQFSVAYVRRVLAVCQLYDYANHRWLDFEGNPTGDLIQ